MAEVIRCGDFVGPGERLAAEVLQRDLPASWTVICNKELMSPDGSTREVDFIIVGERSVFVVDEKSWSGVIHGNENGWVVSTGESLRSPIQTVSYLARRLAGLLRDNVPHLKDTITEHFVTGLVLLSSEKVRFHVHAPGVGEHIVRLSDSAARLLQSDACARGGGVTLGAFAKGIVRYLTGLPDRPIVPRRIGDYSVTDVLPCQGPVRAYDAVHDSGVRRILKVIPMPTVLDADEYRHHRDFVTREYDALAKLADSRCAPQVDLYFTWNAGLIFVIPIHPTPGQTLRADRQRGCPSRDRVFFLAVKSFRGLAMVHRTGVVHRAITPDRIVISGEDVVFTDFVIARVAGLRTVRDLATGIDDDTGFVAPECIDDLGAASRRSDVYALGASLISWWTGLESGSETTWKGILAELIKRENIRSEDILVRALNEAVSIRTGERPTAAGMLLALEDCKAAEKTGESGSGVKAQH